MGVGIILWVELKQSPLKFDTNCISKITTNLRIRIRQYRK